MHHRLLLVLTLLAPPALAAPMRPEEIHHVMVYYQPGRFGGWPANHGIWSWGNEILVGFSEGTYRDLGPDRHHIDREKPEQHWLARSLDGGETWTVTDPAPLGYLIPEGGFLHGVPRSDIPIPQLKTQTVRINFAHPDFALTLRTTSIDAGTSRYWYSYDRGHTWDGPYPLPNFGTIGTAARTDYIVNGPNDCTIFITAAKDDGKEGRPLCAHTEDGGISWQLLGWIGPQPEGYAIMPATVRLDDNTFLSLIRRKDPPKSWIAAWISRDNGKYWQHLNDPVPDAAEGNPASLIRLQDGRLCMTYGYRAHPFSIRAKISNDNGNTWSPDITLRDDGANRDIGYTRMVQRPDGKIVVLYYASDLQTGPERYIAATIWHPDSLPPRIARRFAPVRKQ